MIMLKIAVLLTSMFAFCFASMLGRRLFPLRTTSSLIRQANNVSEFHHPAFLLERKQYVKEYGVTVLEYKHKRSGAAVLSIIAPEDTNKVFVISFRTPPSDSMGIPHILEHSVLCGSRKYPVKEPFVDMLKGSLQTFLNAFTYPDRTCYPVASMNTKDFYNLVNVYMDAVLHPRALHDPKILQQEGWHYELENKSEPLVYKGVVYNEMKGVYSSPDQLMDRTTQTALFPDNAYSVDSGGDPCKIPDLNFSSFQNFHGQYYHPSNAKIVFYGDDDPLERLELLNSYLQDYNISAYSTLNSKIEKQPLTNLSHTRIQAYFPLSSEAEAKHMFTVNWVLHDDPLSQKDGLTLAVLNHLLLGTSSSTLYKALMDSNLGESVIGGGVSAELVQHTFSIGLKGIRLAHSNESDAAALDHIKEIILTCLHQLSMEGFESNAINASVNTIEFHLREFNTGSFPKGLSMALAMMGHWIYDRPPLDGIQFENALTLLKSDIAQGKPVFQNLLRKLFLENDHMVEVLMIPDPQMEQSLQDGERVKLESIKDGLSESEIGDIMNATKALKEMQTMADDEEAKKTIPTLSLQDIDKVGKEIPMDLYCCSRSQYDAWHILNSSCNDMDLSNGLAEYSERVPLLMHSLSSNGILYVDLALDYHAVLHEDLMLLPLYSRMLLEAGTLDLDSVAFSQLINTYTGGIGVSVHNSLKHGADGSVPNPTDTLLYMIVRGKATKENVHKLFDLFTDILTRPNLDNKHKFMEMLRETIAAKESSVITRGNSYAAMRIASRSSYLGYISEQTGGVEYIRQLDVLLSQVEHNWPAVCRRLKRIHHAIMPFKQRNANAYSNSSSDFVINLTGDEELLSICHGDVITKQFLPKLLHYHDRVGSNPNGEDRGRDYDNATSLVLSVDGEGVALPSVSNTSTTTGADELSCNNTLHTMDASLLSPRVNEAFVIPSQVNFVTMGDTLFLPGEQTTGAFAVAAKYISNGYLWDSVRVLGGAYGGFCSFGQSSGRFVFSSFRDPNIADTLSVYEQTPNASCHQQLNDSSILQSVIGLIGSLDSPMSVDQKGFTSLAEWLSGETAADRQLFRQQIMRTSKKDLEDFFGRLTKLIAESKASGGSVAVFGSKTAIDRANEQLVQQGKTLLTIQPPIFNAKSLE